MRPAALRRIAPERLVGRFSPARLFGRRSLESEVRRFSSLTASEEDHAAFLRRQLDGSFTREALPPPKAPKQKEKKRKLYGKRAVKYLDSQIQSAKCLRAEQVLAYYEQNRPDFAALNLCTALHRVGVLSLSFKAESLPLLLKLAEHSAASIEYEPPLWRPKELTQVVWALARIDTLSTELFLAVAVEAQRKMHLFQARELSKIVWSFSSVPGAFCSVSALAMYESVSVEFQLQLKTATAKDLSEMIWAFGQANFPAPALFEAIADAAVAVKFEKIAAFTADDLGNVAWAFAKAACKRNDLYTGLATASIRKMDSFNAQHVSRLAWALSKAGFQAPALFRALADHAQNKIKSFKPGDLATTAWAFSTAGLEEAGLFQALASEAAKSIAAFDGEDLATIIWSFAASGNPAPALFEAASHRLESKLRGLSKSALSRLHQSYILFRLETVQNPLTRVLARHDAVLRQAYADEHEA
ncbi:hypothetical protein M885DRAFT_515946 [Pelagophyceae sp. CCMP2097]|nr:hypothetical protein M885DRAFT_515946 [Pelagophyceae sp. CCMP2097]